MRLTKKQSIALDTLEDSTNSITEVIYGGSAGSGKSIIGCYWLAKSALRYSGTRWLLGRSVLKTLKQTTLQSMFFVLKLQGLTSGVHYNYKEQSGEIHFFNGSVIILADLDYYPSDSEFDRLGGLEITGAFIDEIAQIRKKAWDVVKSRIRYKLKEFGLIPKLLGSLNPSKNWVFTYFYKPMIYDELDYYKSFIQALPTDNPHLDESYLETLRNLPTPERNRLYYGLWEANDERQLITQDNIHNLFTNSYLDSQIGYYITVDVARQGKDKSVIMVWNGLVVIDIITIDKNTIVELADKVRSISNKYKVSMSNVIADESGVGGGLIDILKCKGFLGGSKALLNENYLNLRTQCFYYLSDYINDNKLWIKYNVSEDIKSLIIEELEQIQLVVSDLDDKRRIIGKDEIKSNIGRSTDYSDTLSMRMYFELNKNNGLYNII